MILNRVRMISRTAAQVSRRRSNFTPTRKDLSLSSIRRVFRWKYRKMWPCFLSGIFVEDLAKRRMLLGMNPQSIQFLTRIVVQIPTNRLGTMHESLSGHYNDEVSGSLCSAALADVVRLNGPRSSGKGVRIRRQVITS